MQKKFKFVLCVDDNEADLFYNRFLLEQANISDELIEHTEIEDALKTIQDYNKNTFQDLFPSLIILDLNMPMYNGIEFVEKFSPLFLSLKEKGVLSLILTTSLNPNDIRKVKENEIVEEFIQKPFKISSIEKYLHFDEGEYREKFLKILS